MAKTMVNLSLHFKDLISALLLYNVLQSVYDGKYNYNLDDG